MITDAELDKGLTTMKVIWGTMLFSLAVYVVIATQFGDSIGFVPEGNPKVLDIVRTVFYLLALVILVVIRFVRRAVLAGKGMALGGQPSALSHPVLQKYLSAMMIALALSESIGIFGFVLFLAGKKALDLYLLVALSAAAMIIYRPKKNELLALMQEEQMRAAMGGGG
ncbi:MAG: hypothetical protein NDI73_01345 [Desulfuromonadales bacterium]|nr:hypothetical protein [Desulfuromonadales bacterium]